MLTKKYKFLLFFLSIIGSQNLLSQRVPIDNFLSLINGIRQQVISTKQTEVVFPNDTDLREWGNILKLFRAGMADSCKDLLAKYNYTLFQIKDGASGHTYDVFRERSPIQKGWGTFIYNRNHKKRLYIHVNHPVDDSNGDVIGAELFRKLEAEWLFIAGTRRFFGSSGSVFDVGKERRTVFQRWHELLTDLTHITLSVHGYNPRSYSNPIKSTQLIISNGKTTDEQWGISEISLAFRDSMRSAGLKCGLAMYDSGYARLAGGWNAQGTFTNDSVGFGHWFYIELSNTVRENRVSYLNFIAAANRALELTGKKISQQMNRAWGLVSPRVVKVDSLHRMMFPPASAETYRIISFNANSMKNDTLDIRMGNWLEVLGSPKTITRVTKLDSSNGSLADQYRGRNRAKSGRGVSQLVKESSVDLVRRLHLARDREIDSSGSEDEPFSEPLQVHRIPLQPILSSTISNDNPEGVVQFRWEGMITGRLKPNIPTFQLSNSQSADEFNAMPNFLIPIINSSYRTGKSRFIGVHMTEMLINEIARLVNEHKVADKDIGLIAEQMAEGDYYLRIFPANQKKGR